MDRAELEEIFRSLGPVTIKRMFGGKGIYCDGKILGVEFEGELLLKADATSAPLFEEAGCRQWGYEHNKTGKPVKMPYWSIPDEAFDDPDIMAEWVRLAFEAALRSK
jgi:DNA transformation protein and related proteins